MSEMNCIIVEDEPLAARVLESYIKQTPGLSLIGICEDALSAMEVLNANKVDLIFLDINLPKINGLEFIKTLQKNYSIVLTTAYHQYAVEGFDLNVTDYLLKPFDFERFLMAVTKVRTAQGERMKTTETEETKDHLFLNVQKKKVKILFSEIVYIESQQEYIKLVTTKKVYFSKVTTSEMENILPSNLFKRIHRSYIVSVNKIDSYNSEMVEVNGISIPIGRSYRHIIDGL